MALANQQLAATDRAAATLLPLPLLQLQRSMGKKAKKGKAAASAEDDDDGAGTADSSQVKKTRRERGSTPLLREPMLGLPEGALTLQATASAILPYGGVS